MAENENGQEKTHAATPKRIDESRKKGEIARSKELNTLLILLVSGGGLLFLGDHLIDGLMQILRDSFTIERENIFNPASMITIFVENLYKGINAVLPLFVLLVVIAVVAPMALGGWSFSLESLKPDIKKIDPVKGMGKVFSLKGLLELVKALAKFLIVGSVGYFIMQIKIPDFIMLGTLTLEQALATMGNDLIWIFILLSSALFFVVIFDVPFQIWDHSRKLKMTLQEIKDENKQTEGNPELKAKIRRTQMEITSRRMMQEVPKADVVITNPTHYAVALRYDQEEMGAPIVVAMGVDEVAGHIRRVAAANDVPILSAPPLARALYYNTELDREISSGLYLAVAQVLAYVFQLRNHEKSGGSAPVFNADSPIPEDLRREQ